MKRTIRKNFATFCAALALFSMIPCGVQAQDAEGTLTITGTEGGFSQTEINGSITITKDGSYTITGNQVPTNSTISVKSGTADITLDNVNIDANSINFVGAIDIFPGAAVNLTLKGSNTLRGASGNIYGSSSSADIAVPGGAALTITADSTGSLEAKAPHGSGGACIGAKCGGSCGSITINGGTITATGSMGGGTGIGGADLGSSCGSITINGGKVTAHGDDAGIGMGIPGYFVDDQPGYNSGSITINGGEVTATGENGAGIGGCGTTTVITGGTVNATGGFCSAGIGDSFGSNSPPTVIIRGGTVNATGGYGGGAGIGGAQGLGAAEGHPDATGSCGTIVISGGTVTAIGGDVYDSFGGPGIGSGAGSSVSGGGSITISGGTVTATRGACPSANDIGSGYCKNSQNHFGDVSLVITGGSVHATNNSLCENHTDGKNNYVYLNTVTFDSLTEKTDVHCTVNSGTPFPCATDNKSVDDTAQVLYLWLPAGTKQNELLFAADTSPDYYQASGTIRADDTNTMTASALTLSITAQPKDAEVFAGDPVSLSVTAVATDSKTFQWYKNTANASSGGVEIAGAAESSYSAPTDTAGTTYYYCVVKSGPYTRVSDAAAVTVMEDEATCLTDLAVNGSTVSGFDRNTVAYKVTPVSDSSFGNAVKVSATLEEPNSSLTIDGKMVACTDSVGTAVVSLHNGANLIPVTVTSDNGKRQKSYILSVNGIVNDTDLKELSIGGAAQTIGTNTTFTVSAGLDVDAISVTAVPSDDQAVMLLNGGVLKSGIPQTVDLTTGTNTFSVMVVAQDATVKTYTIKVIRQTAVAITTESLPIGIVGTHYSKSLEATGGSGSYTWSWAPVSGSFLPPGIALGEDGTLSGAVSEKNTGTYVVQITVEDTGGQSSTKKFTFKLDRSCGNGAYLIVPDDDTAYSGSYSDEGIPLLTVNGGVSGFTYFSVAITPVTGHTGEEVCVFVQERNGQQISLSFNKADYDTVGSAGAAFNVKAGDIIEVYLVDVLSNSGGSTILRRTDHEKSFFIAFDTFLPVYAFRKCVG